MQDCVPALKEAFPYCCQYLLSCCGSLHYLPSVTCLFVAARLVICLVMFIGTSVNFERLSSSVVAPCLCYCCNPQLFQVDFCFSFSLEVRRYIKMKSSQVLFLVSDKFRPIGHLQLSDNLWVIF